jgi:hypothetical protein
MNSGIMELPDFAQFFEPLSDKSDDEPIAVVCTF